MSSSVTLSLSDGICVVTLQNAARRNAISRAMWTQLSAFTSGDPAAFGRVVIFRGEGDRAFSAGADISEFGSGRSNAAASVEYDDQVENTCVAIERIPVPTIAVIQGACMGAGASLAASCDIRIAGATGFFAVPAAKLGLGYDPRGVDRFCRVFGRNISRWMLFSGSRLPAERAHALGAVFAIFSPDEVIAASRSLAAEIRDNAPLTIAAAKSALRAAESGQQEIRAEADRLYRMADASADYLEGKAAFAEKRRPHFKGV